MELTELITFALAALLLVVSPGPNGFLIAKTVPTSGKPAGFASVAGFAVAFYVHGLLSILGISVILMQSAQLFFIVKMLGAAYLCWIGFQALRGTFADVEKSPVIEPSKTSKGLGKAFTEGFLTCGLNPKVSMFYLAVFPQFMPQSDEVFVTAFTLLFIHSTLNIIWFSSMVILFGHLTKVAKNEGFQRWLSGITGIAFIGFGLKLATLKS